MYLYLYTGMKKSLIICKNMLGQKKKANFTNKFHFIDKHRFHIVESPTKNNLYCNLYKLWRLTLDHDKPTVLGGDHSLAISTLSSSICKYGQNIKILWIDAHADINSYSESTTKNIHGMVLNFVCDVNTFNQRNHYNQIHYSMFVQNRKIDPKNILYLGIRDLDNYEKDLLRQYNISHIDCKTINDNPDKCIHIVNKFIGKDKYHMSLDIDAIEPEYVPCTGTPVEDGIKLSNLLYILKNTNMKNKIHTDIVEYNPSLGNLQQQRRTQQTILSLLDVL